MRRYLVSALDSNGVFHEVVEGVEASDLLIGDIIMFVDPDGESISPREMVVGAISGLWCWEIVGSSTVSGFYLKWGSDGRLDECYLESDLPVYWRVIRNGDDDFPPMTFFREGEKP